MPRTTETKISLSLGVAGGVAIIAGYVDLWRGGTALASLLLVLGYLVLVPLAIWRLTRPAGVHRHDLPRTQTDRPPYLAATVVALALFALYAATLAPDTAMWDTSEYIAVAKVLGLPHPPGNPTFVLLAHVFGMLPLPVAYAARINLLAALASAASAGLWFLCGERLSRRAMPRRWTRLVVAGMASLVGGTAFTVWNQSVVNEKVYTVSLFGLSLSSWLVLRWLDDVATERETSAVRRRSEWRPSDRWLCVVAYLAGIAYTVHPAGFLVLPAIAVAVVMRAPRTLVRWRLLLGMCGLLALGLTPFAFEPIRAGHHPAVNEGVPTACTGRGPEMGCTFSATTARALRDNIERKQYGGHAVLDRQAPYDAQLSMFWLYFRWQWLRDVSGMHPRAQEALAIAFLLFGVTGLETTRRNERAAWSYLMPLAGTLTFALVFYLNFKYGWSQAPELRDAVPREVRDRDYFFIWTFSLWGLFAAMGVGTLWRALATALRRWVSRERLTWMLATPVLAFAIVPLVANASSASRAGQHFTSAWAIDLLDSVEPYGVLVTNGDNDSFPLWYAQEVLGVRRDVTVALVPYLGIADYQKELMRREPATYDRVHGPRRFASRTWTRPTSPLWRMTPEEVDAVPDYIEIQQPMRFHANTIDAIVQPGYLTRDKLAILRAIQDSFPERAFYFVGSGYASSLGLAPYVRQEGLVQRLEPVPAASVPGTVELNGLAVNAALTESAWERYAAPAQLLREGKWVDPASAGIVWSYMVAAEQVAELRAGRNDEAAARALGDTIRAMARAARIPLE